MSNKAIGAIIWIIIAVFVLGLVVTIIQAYWLWLVIAVVAAALLWFGVPVLYRVVTTRTFHR